MAVHTILNQGNLKIKYSQIPVFEKWPGATAFGKACDQMESGEWDGLVEDRYEVVYHDGDGIWCIAGLVGTLDEAMRLAGTVQPSPLVTVPAGYAITSTGDMVLQDDWDEIEGSI